MFQAAVLSVIAEQSWAFTAAPVLINLAKSLASDPEALSRLSMDRTSASIKMKFALAPSITARTVALMKQQKFSLNIDESTSTNSTSRVLTVLVNVFDRSVGKVTTQHLSSISLVTVNTESVFSALIGLFEEHGIPWDNCLSILMDSCAVMRGSKSGLERRIREEKAEQLLDIDGDVCHHLHNATKKFCGPFKNWVEDLFKVLYNEFHWSSSNEDILKEIFFLLGEKYSKPHHFAPYRWLSCLDAAQSCLLQMNALTLYAFAFLTKSDKPTYQGIVDSIVKDFSKQARARLNELHCQLNQKSATEDGKKRRLKLVTKLFFNRKWTRMVLGVYSAVLPTLKEYVTLFQSAEPLTHMLCRKQMDVFISFLALFMKSSAFTSLQPQELKDPKVLNVSDERRHLPNSLVFTGRCARSILTAYHPSDKNASLFYTLLKEAYVACGTYLQAKLPLDNRVVQCLSFLDPASDFGSDAAQLAFQDLDKMTNIISSEEGDAFDKEVKVFGADGSLPAPDKSVSVDVWWGLLSATGKYPLICRMATSLLTCFHGPAVESSFSVMGDVLDCHSSRMKTDTYSAIQTVKYGLRAGGQSAVNSFKRKDKLHTPVNKNMCRLLRGANKKHRLELEAKQAEIAKKREELSLKKQKELSKQKAKAELAEAEKKARLAHKKAMRAKLEALARKKRIEQRSKDGSMKKQKEQMPKDESRSAKRKPEDSNETSAKKARVV